MFTHRNNIGTHPVESDTHNDMDALADVVLSE